MKNLKLKFPGLSGTSSKCVYSLILLHVITTTRVMSQNNSSADMDLIGITGSSNVAFGEDVLINMPTSGGSFNVGIGRQALFLNQTGSGNTAGGFQSLYSNINTHYNTSFGYQALYAAKSAANTAFGYQSLSSTLSGHDNVAVGYWSLLNNYNGDANTAVGANALKNNYSGLGNTAIGWSSLVSNYNGFNNVAVGKSALSVNYSGYENVAVGDAALGTNVTGKQNIAIGVGALGLNKVDRNVAIGYSAMGSNTTGQMNTAIGTTALMANATSFSNVAVGTNALCYNTGDNNVGIGVGAVQTGGATNVGVGTAALTNCTGQSNSCMGHWAAVNATSADYNSSCGFFTLYNLSSGDYNTAVGYNALGSVTNQNFNAGLGSWCNVQTNAIQNSAVLGHNSIALNSNEVRLGSTTTTIITGNPLGYTSTSDGRFKTNIKEDVKGIEFIKRLRPVIYNLDTKKQTEFITQNMPDSLRKHYLDSDFGPSTAIRQTGFIAQEVEIAAKETGFDFNGIHKPSSETDHYGLTYSSFVVPLVKAVQEQQQMIEDLKNSNILQQQLIEELSRKLVTTAASSNGLAQEEFSMNQNIPNPFTNETLINYTVSEQTKTAVLNVYDLSGKQIASFPITEKGSSSITITSEKLAAGIYIYSIVADGKVMDSKRMIVAEK